MEKRIFYLKIGDFSDFLAICRHMEALKYARVIQLPVVTLPYNPAAV